MEYDLYAQLESFNTRLTVNTMNFLMKEGEMTRYEPGAVISREGENSDHVFIVIEGEAVVRKTDHLGGQTELATIGPGGLFGEMGVFLNMRRSATIEARTPLSVVRFSNQSFINALPRTPDLVIKLLRSLTEKINKVNWRVADMAICNAMLVIGTYLLEGNEENGRATIGLDRARVLRETGLPEQKILDALRTLIERGLLETRQASEQTWTLEVRVPELKTFLRKLATKG